MKATPLLLAALMLGCKSAPISGTGSPSAASIVGNEADARAILAARDTLNQALRDRSVAFFAHFWLPDLQTVAGDGAARSGRDTAVATFTRSFSNGGSFVSGLRTPERIEAGVSGAGLTQAAESGRWVWRTQSEGGVTEAAGRYLIFWRKTPEGWRIRSETYVTTACVSGPRCPK